VPPVIEDLVNPVTVTMSADTTTTTPEEEAKAAVQYWWQDQLSLLGKAREKGAQASDYTIGSRSLTRDMAAIERGIANATQQLRRALCRAGKLPGLQV